METKSIGRGSSIRDIALNSGKSSSIDGLDKSQRTMRGTQNNTDESVSVSLSPEARELADAKKKALSIALNTPDVREDRVAEIKRKIASGEYQIDSEKIADGILREAIREKLAGVPE